MKTTQLARKFSELLVVELGAETIAEINKRNSGYSLHGKDCCASHEFCDANVTMDSAFQAITGREMDTQSDTDCQLFSGAWKVARGAKFNAKAIL